MTNPPRQTSAASEERFRQIFFAHLEAEGFTESDAYQLIFKTPAVFHEISAREQGLELLEASRENYQRQLAHSWFFEGLGRKPADDEQCLQAPERPVTFVIVPGIFGEFIEQLPFQSVVDRENSRFRKKWQASLEEVPERVYSLLELAEVPCRLTDVVEIGSLDQGARSFANVIVLKAQAGSLETLGSLASNVKVFQRRLARIFEVIEDDSDIYLVGYSRGLAVALDLVSTLHEERKAGSMNPETAAWFERLKGVVGLGGVYYGANFAQDVLAGRSGATSDLISLLLEAADRLATVPKGAKLAEKTEIVAGNARAWSNLVKKISAAEAPKVAAGKSFMGISLQEAVAREGKARLMDFDVPAPNPWGVFSLVRGFFLKTFKLKKFVTRYNENILALKRLVTAVIVAVKTLTPASRDQWWRGHELPDDLVLLSITGTMPDAYLHDFGSPLWRFAGYGAKTSDYNVSLRSSYYDVIASENTLINDSQVSHFCSRYWAQMYPGHQYEHHYLGVLGTHHWGMAFPFTIKDDKKVGGNAFPRTTMLRSIAAYVASL